MPLEFPCPRCQHLLRTADDKAGLSATCPACGESIWVPYAHELGAAQSKQPPHPDDDPPSDRYELEDPFAEEPAPQPREAAGDDPFAAETSPVGRDDAGPFESEPQIHDVEPQVQPAGPGEGWQPRDPDAGEILQSSWRVFTEEMLLLVGSMLLLGAIFIGIEIVWMIPAFIGAAIAASMDGDLTPVGFIAGLLLGLPLVIPASIGLHIGYLKLNLNVARGQPAGIGDLFYGFREGRSQILPLFLVSLVANLFSFCTCGLGGIIIWPVGYLVVHRRTDTGAGLQQGIEFIQKEFVTILLVGLIAGGIFLSLYVLNFCFYIGMVLAIFVMPFLVMMMTVGYLRMERERIVVDRD